MRPSSVIVLTVQRDVEIAADQHALAVQIPQIVDGLHLDTPFRMG
jgi:hypothetical protein